MNNRIDYVKIGILAIAVIVLGFFIVKQLSKTDYNCSDFKTQQEAQQKFSENSEDIYNLDGDNDGIACKNLLGSPSPSPTTNRSTNPVSISSPQPTTTINTTTKETTIQKETIKELQPSPDPQPSPEPSPLLCVLNTCL